MLHCNAMKKLFLTFFSCVVMYGTAFAAPLKDSVAASAALDTVRATFDDGRVSRIYTVLKPSARNTQLPRQCRYELYQ